MKKITVFFIFIMLVGSSRIAYAMQAPREMASNSRVAKLAAGAFENVSDNHFTGVGAQANRPQPPPAGAVESVSDGNFIIVNETDRRDIRGKSASNLFVRNESLGDGTENIDYGESIMNAFASFDAYSNSVESKSHQEFRENTQKTLQQNIIGR